MGDRPAATAVEACSTRSSGRAGAASRSGSSAPDLGRAEAGGTLADAAAFSAGEPSFDGSDPASCMVLGPDTPPPPELDRTGRRPASSSGWAGTTESAGRPTPETA
jgi:hypothetical protein